MTNQSHDLIQRYVDGQATVEETATVQAEMKHDANLRELYLDYVNLDVALAAAAEAAAIPKSGVGDMAAVAPMPGRKLPRYGRWFAGAAACASLILCAVLSRILDRPQSRPDVDAACCSTQAAIASLSAEPPSFPAWMSPTAPLLAPLRPVKGDL